MDISASNILVQANRPTRDMKNLPDASELLAAAATDTTKKTDSSIAVQSAAEAKAAAKAKNDQAIADFTSYMNKSTMEKYTEAWLQKHGISKEKFDKMTPEEKEKVIAQMKQDIERETKEAMQKKPLNILA